MNTKTKSSPIIIALITAALSNMTREDLRKVATVAEIPRGKDKPQTIANLAKAVDDGKLQFKALCTLQLPPSDTGTSYKKAVLIRKLRSYKPEKNLLVAQPKAPAPVAS
jgi:hypothetical protein